MLSRIASDSNEANLSVSHFSCLKSYFHCKDGFNALVGRQDCLNVLAIESGNPSYIRPYILLK